MTDHEYDRFTLDQYLEGEKTDSNLFWRMPSGVHLNLLDEAIERMVTETDLDLLRDCAQTCLIDGLTGTARRLLALADRLEGTDQ